MKNANSSIYSFISLSGLIFLLLTLFSSCEKDTNNPKNPNPKDHADHGFITTVELVFEDSSNAANTFSFVFSDPDGPGGLPPVRTDTIHLESGKTYFCKAKFFDATDGGKELTSSIKAENKDHIMCYQNSGNLAQKLTILRTDSDGKYEVGLETKWTTLGAATGETTVTLKHQVGTKDGTCLTGSTDVEVRFPVIIE